MNFEDIVHYGVVDI